MSLTNSSAIFTMRICLEIRFVMVRKLLVVIYLKFVFTADKREQIKYSSGQNSTRKIDWILRDFD